MAIKVANNQSLTAITALPSAISSGAMTLLETQTASSSATISFTSNIDSTYKEYQFHFTDIHPATDSAMLTFQADTGTNTSYNQTITSTNFRSKHSENDDAAGVEYRTARDLAQSTSFKQLSEGVDNDNDSSLCGILHIFEPSSSTFVKHFISRCIAVINYPTQTETYAAGYFNTTTALTRFQFKMNSGNMDSGTIKLYGIS
jgi:hypothetical protein